MHQFLAVALLGGLFSAASSMAAEPAVPSEPAAAAVPADGMVGDKTCRKCHSDETAAFKQTVHSKTEFFDIKSGGCEGCHGPGARHAKSKNPADIVNPGKEKGAAASEVCEGCHKSDSAQKYWVGSPHEMLGVGCTNCHSVHRGNEKMLKTAWQPDTCFQCHQDQRAAFSKRSVHNIRDISHANYDAKMSCSSCHNPHGSQAPKLVNANTVNDLCYTCHQEKQAPVLWEHSAVKENCQTCHEPHGSNNLMMLVAKEPRLCQQCHEQGRHQTLAGQPESFFVTTRGCSNCHASIHGTNNPSGLKIKN